MKHIFNGLYTLIVIRFIRLLYRKLIPAPVSLGMPKYLLIAMFTDYGMLLGYSDSLTECRKYSDAAYWMVTISMWDGHGKYRDIERNDEYEEDSKSSLIGFWEADNKTGAMRDGNLAEKFGFDRIRMKKLVESYRHGNFV